MNRPAYETLIYECVDQCVEIRFNRPHRLNAVVEQLYIETIDALKRAEADPAVRTVVLTGEGRAFCVGADLKEHANGHRTPYQRRQYLQLGNAVCEALFSLSKPVIASVHGYALGAGAEMAIACDFILMAESAQIGFPEVTIGTSVGGGVTQTLPRLVGLGKARELLFIGERIDGVEAARIGLATRSYPDDELRNGTADLAAALASRAPVSMSLVKGLINGGEGRDMSAQLGLELDAVFACSSTEDWKEGVDAFAEKRSPRFRGR